MDFDTLNTQNTLISIAKSYNQSVSRYGACSKAVMWSSDIAQISRFKVLSSIIKKTHNLTINDYGCGYGSFFDFLSTVKLVDKNSIYYGYDISVNMIENMKSIYKNDKRVKPILNYNIKTLADYSFSSGTFGLKLETETSLFKSIIKKSILNLGVNSKIGFAFNMLDVDGTKEKQPALFYADSNEFLKFCKDNFKNKTVTLIKDYCPDDFTITVTD